MSKPEEELIRQKNRNMKTKTRVQTIHPIKRRTKITTAITTTTNETKNVHSLTVETTESTFIH